MSVSAIDWISEAYRQQNDYNDVFAEWKMFDRGHTDYIKSMIGLMLFGIQEDVENPPSTVSYYQVYSAEKRKIIDTIYGHVRKCQFDNDVLLSCTYLIGKDKNNGTFQFPVLRYSRSLSGQVYFAEITGRYYKNWDDFLASNQLPPCEFIAPHNGLYTQSTPVYMRYTSPAASANRKLTNFANRVACAGAVACTAASMCAIAPVTVLTVGLGLSALGVKQSISVLRDRSNHGQSIALDNRESLLSYGNIVANSLSGASFAAISNLGRLQRLFGNYANAVTTTCKVLNISTIVLDSSFLVVNACDFFAKLRTGTITSRDVFDLSLQIFLVVGAVTQARDIHTALKKSQLSPSTLVNKKLTKTQKRNLLRRRAKARARGELPVASVSSSSESTTSVAVGENDTFSSLKSFSLKVGSFGLNVMMNMYPRAELLLNYYYDLRDLMVRTFVSRTMKVNEFLQQLFYHSRNLYTILRQDIARMKEILRLCVPDPSINDNELIAQTMNNEMDRINVAAEELMPTLQLETLEETERRPDENASTEQIHTPLHLMLKFVYETCTKYTIKDTADAHISFFHTILVVTTNYVQENCVKLFDETFQRSSKVVGIEKAKLMASVLGTTIEKDFHPTIACMEKVLEDSELILQEFMKHFINIEFQENECSPLAREIFEKYFQLMSTVSARVISPPRIVGLHRTVKILQDISSDVENKLCGECRKLSHDSRSLYEENVGILGKAIVDEMMKTIEMPTSEIEFFRSALTTLKVDDLVSKVKAKRNCSDEFTQTALPSTSQEVEEEEEKPYEALITQLVKTLFEKLKDKKFAPRFTSKSKLFMNITNFVAEKLITELKLDAKLYEELKSSVELVGPKLLKAMLEIIGMYASEKSYLFKTKTQLLSSDRNIENMVDEFSRRYRNTEPDIQHLAKIFETTIGDDGFTTYKITCDQRGSNESFTELVYLLFNVKIDESDCRIERDERSVVIKSKNNVITFTFPGEENIALVIFTDLDCMEE